MRMKGKRSSGEGRGEVRDKKEVNAFNRILRIKSDRSGADSKLCLDFGLKELGLLGGSVVTVIGIRVWIAQPRVRGIHSRRNEVSMKHLVAV